MSRLRASLIAVVAAAGLLALAAAGLYGLVRLSWFERHAGERLSSALGWPVEIGGLQIAYFPLPRIEVEGLRVAMLPEPGGAPLAEAGAVSVTLPWRTVIGLGGHVARLELRAPRLHLARDAGGPGNWQALADHLAARGQGGPASFSIGELHIVDGAVDFTGGAPGKVSVAGLQLSAHDVRPGDPFSLELRLAGESAGRTFHAVFTGRVMLDPDREVYAADELVADGWLGGDGLPLAGVEWDATLGALHADLTAGSTTVRDLKARALGVALAAAGEWVSQGPSPPALAFDLTTEPFSPRAVAARLDRTLPATADPEALSRLALSAKGTWSEPALVLETVSGEFDGSRFSGSATLPAGDAPPVLRLAVDTLDVDRYLPPAPAGAAEGGGLEAALGTLRDTLETLDLDAEITVGEARGAGVLARDLVLRLKPLPAEPST